MIQLKPFRTSGILPVLAGMALTGVHAQTMTDKPNDPMMKIYRATPAKINDLVHTKTGRAFRLQEMLSMCNGIGWTIKLRTFAPPPTA